MTSICKNKYLFLSIILILVARLISMTFFPLFDTTETRYAEIARKMVELSDFITPYISYEQPFFGKPPLSFWATALSYKLFGINEFTARLPHFLTFIMYLLVTYWFCKRNYKTIASSLAFILTTTLFFVGFSGTVMTDQVLSLFYLIALVAFWEAMQGHKKIFWYTWIISTALTLLTKGLVGPALIAMTIIVWLTLTKNWRKFWKEVPIFTGGIIFLLITLPWFIVMHLRHPEFLNYFFLGEHFARFTTPGWDKDLYGKGRNAGYGAVILFFLLGMIPWTFISSICFLKKRRLNSDLFKNDFLVFNVVATAILLVFFSLTANVVLAYPLPIIGFSSIILGHFLNDWILGRKKTLIFIAILSTGISLYPLYTRGSAHSNKLLVESYYKDSNGSLPIYGILNGHDYSTDFYMQGNLIRIDKEGLKELISKKSFYAILPASQITEFSNDLIIIDKNEDYFLGISKVDA